MKVKLESVVVVLTAVLAMASPTWSVPDVDIWKAAASGNIKAINQHTADGSDLNAKEPVGGSTPLMVAALFGQTEAAKLLIQKGANVNIKNNDGSTALHLAAAFGLIETVELLLAKGADVDARKDDGKTALDDVAGMWSEELEGIYRFVALLLQIPMDESRLQKIKANRPIIANILRKSGGFVVGSEPSRTVAVKEGGVDIFAAAGSGNIKAINQHVAAGAGLNVKEPSGGGTPLMVAVLFGQTEAAKLLIQKGANANIKNNDGATALHIAAFFGHPEVVKLLLAKGADVNARNKKGETALDNVAGMWSDELEGLYRFFGQIFGLPVNDVWLEKIKANRPIIADILRDHSNRSGRESAGDTGRGVAELPLRPRPFDATQDVRFLSPRPGVPVREELSIRVLKPDMEGGYVVLSLDGQFLTSIGSPFEHRIDLKDRRQLSRLNLQDGEHRLSVVAWNAFGGQEGRAEVAFTVAQSVALGTSPEGIKLKYVMKPGDTFFYTTRVRPELKAVVAQQSVTEHFPSLENIRVFQWNQFVRSMSVDRVFQVSRELEDIKTFNAGYGPSRRTFRSQQNNQWLIGLKQNGGHLSDDHPTTALLTAADGTDLSVPEEAIRVGVPWPSPPSLLPIQVGGDGIGVRYNPTSKLVGFESFGGETTAKIESTFKVAAYVNPAASEGASSSPAAGAGGLGAESSSRELGAFGPAFDLKNDYLKEFTDLARHVLLRRDGEVLQALGDLAEGTVWLGVPPVRSMTKNLAAGKRFEHFMLDFERNRALLEVPLEPDGKPLKLSGLFGEGTGIRTTWIDFVKGRVVASKEIIELEFETDTRFLEKIKPIEQLTREMSGGLTTASGARIQLSDDIPDYAIMMMGIGRGTDDETSEDTEEGDEEVPVLPVDLFYRLEVDTRLDSVGRMADLFGGRHSVFRSTH